MSLPYRLLTPYSRLLIPDLRLLTSDFRLMGLWLSRSLALPRGRTQRLLARLPLAHSPTLPILHRGWRWLFGRGWRRGRFDFRANNLSAALKNPPQATAELSVFAEPLGNQMPNAGKDVFNAVQLLLSRYESSGPCRQVTRFGPG